MNQGPLGYQEQRSLMMVVPVLVLMMYLAADQLLGFQGGIGWLWFGGISWVVWAVICGIGGPEVARVLSAVLSLITMILIGLMIWAAF